MVKALHAAHLAWIPKSLIFVRNGKIITKILRYENLKPYGGQSDGQSVEKSVK